MALPGEIFRHGAFYLDEQNRWQPKYLVVLARSPSDDVIFRLLTSRQRDRPRNPPCFHGDPLPSYYLGTIGGSLESDTWVDLRSSDDYDERDFRAHTHEGVLLRVTTLSHSVLRPLLECAAQAPDTTLFQSRAIRDQLASLPARN